MFKKICGLFTQIPFIKRVIENRKQKRLLSIIEELKLAKKTFEESCYGHKELVSLYDVINRVDINPLVLEDIDKTQLVTVYSTTSQNLLEAVRKGYFHKETINRSKIIHLETKTKPISSWLSNTESIGYLIEFTKTMLQKNIFIETATLSKSKQPTTEIPVVSSIEKEFIDSLLYRLVISDFLTVVQLILGTDYENSKRKKSNSP